MIATVLPESAVALGNMAAYGLSRLEYKFFNIKNSDISFFFLSQRAFFIYFDLLLCQLFLFNRLFESRYLSTGLLLPTPPIPRNRYRP